MAERWVEFRALTNSTNSVEASATNTIVFQAEGK